MSHPTSDTHRGELPSRTGGLLMGIGFGGFVDGIVLHQILQWHHMLSHEESMKTVAGLEVNTLADGFFHAATWIFVLAGSIAMLISWRQGRLSPNLPFHLGLLLTGWGLFNVVEGVVDHHILQLHHVRDDLGAPLSWDLGFLAFGVALVVGGWLLHRRGVAALERRQAALSRRAA
ncbi:DUF2243 domain-containing protein [Aeromicrobium wangtongii]|uniref:DUF2243 domain-containing protein n=1 Tax=Aeromicrobium wangtongii TaxID=2969247 RepID=UPI002017CBAF|nr:DUF2243 domain-containing protein [Aeromicrobium wangtongii]MCL3817974.1 DUF2243 domain-containing protein [Aeromicrobium wangtongii]